jgi:hypothetical protein
VASKIEEKFFSEDCRPIGAYHKRHAELYGNRWERKFTLNAPFAFIGTLFAVALITAAWFLVLGK